MQPFFSLFVSVAVFALASMSPAVAQQPTAPVEAAVRQLLEREAAGLPGTVEITVGAMDPGNQLPPCEALEPFLPAGMRAWGQISVGVRCNAPVGWSVYLPAHVAVMMDYLVAARPIRPGQILGPQDIAREHGDLTAQPPNTLTELSQVVGAHTRIAVAAGNTLRADMLRLPPVVQQGQIVKVVGSGRGFSVSNEGRALGRAADGEQVRVRLANGQVLTGTARAGGIVEVRF
ncbi:MAG TPA: flagellar basal body P-ring formation chaperone FlgA [Rhodocyclaceae bacterium]|nr:flagellar basal body P-ring formation chaperone FlgA [Rhodocyclaceae bacterium]